MKNVQVCMHEKQNQSRSILPPRTTRIACSKKPSAFPSRRHSARAKFVMHADFIYVGKRLYWRSDGAWYQAEVLNHCRQSGRTFSITADQDSAVKAAEAQIPEGQWRQFFHRDGLATEREIAETVHCMNETEKAFRLIWEHNQCGESENWHKELKLGYGMEQMPCGTQAANGLFFAIGVLAFNLGC